MLYSRKIVLAIAACVVAVSAAGKHDAQKADLKAKRKAVTDLNAKGDKLKQAPDFQKQLKIANADVVVAQAKLDADIALEAAEKTRDEHQDADRELHKDSSDEDKKNKVEKLKGKLDEQAAKLETCNKIRDLAIKIFNAIPDLENVEIQIAAAKNQKPKPDAKVLAKELANLEKTKKPLSLRLACLRAEKELVSATEVDAMKAAKFVALRTDVAELDGARGVGFHLPTELKCAKAVLQALVDAAKAKTDKVKAEAAKDKAAKDLADMTKARDALQAKIDAAKAKSDEAKAKADKESDKNMFQQFWGYIKSPFSKYSAARKDTFVKDGKTEKLTIFGAVKHALTPSSGTGKAAYVGLAGAAAAGAFGGYKYVENGNEKRKSNSRKKVGLAVAGLAAAGAVAVGAYKGNEWYQAKQNAGEGEMFDDEETGAPQSSGKNSDPAAVSASGDQSKKNKNGKTNSKKKSNKWMIYAAVIVLALAVIGGALYYFLFMTEEGSEEDAVPEGMDQV